MAGTGAGPAALTGWNDVMIPDSVLIERARVGDELAFSALVQRYGDRVVGHLSRLTGCAARAEDLAQDTFIRFFERLDRYDERGQLVAYLVRVATRIFLSEERRRKRRETLGRLFTFEAHTPASAIEEHTYQGEVRDALMQVPPRFRAPLVLYVVEGLSYAEIAEGLGVRPGTVKSRIARARAMLEARLDAPKQESYDAPLLAR